MNSYLASLGPALANHLWQSTAFAIVAWLLTLALRKNQARVRYAVWLAASIKFLIPFSLLVSAGNLLPHPKQPVVAVLYSAMDVVEEPFATAPLPLTTTPVHVPTLWERVEAVSPACLGVLWLTGVGVVVFGWWRRWRVLSQSLHHAAVAREGRELEILRRVESKVVPKRHGAALPLVMSAEQLEPGLFGVIRPVLVWPKHLSARLNDEHIEAIIAHELTHVRRKDNLTALLHLFVEAVFWFHPLVWWIERQMVNEREQACDEAVVEMGGNAEAYAESLVETCRFCIESPLACVAGITGGELGKRIRLIMAFSPKQFGRASRLVLCAVAVGSIAAPIALGLAHRPPVFGQILKATGSRPSFEVASIHVWKRPAPPPEIVGGEQIIHQQVTKFSPGREGAQTSDHVHIIAPLGLLIAQAYGLPPGSNGRADGRIVGGPEWMTQDSDQFDIQAKIDEREYTAMQKMTAEQQREQVNLMKQSLLADRFKLKVHFETRELPAYALVVAKGGTKLRQANDEEPTRLSSTRQGQVTEMSATAATLDQFADSPLLSAGTSGRAIVDQTGLHGKYDFTLKWAAESPAGHEPSDEPALFTAVQEQLGLKLIPTKGPVEVIVVDHIEKPTVDGAEISNPITTPFSLNKQIAMSGATAAGSINGTWQGTLPIPDSPRVALALTKADDGSLRGVLYQIDKTSSGIALTSVTFTPPDLSVGQVNAAISYRGKLSADGKSVAGTWTQDQNSYSLTLVLATPETLWKRNEPAALPPMSPTADPAFEVAAIRLTPPDTYASSYGLKTRDFTAKNRSVRDMIEFSYKLSHRQVSGGPSWMDDTKFDIAARPDTEGLPSIDQYRLMIRKLLASRFQLQIHTVQQTFPVYALTRDPKAPKLPHSGPEFDGVSSCYVKELSDGQTEYHCVGMAMPQFADGLMQLIPDRQIVDETGLAGYFEFTMMVTTSDLHSKQAGDWADAYRRALQARGFKLVPKKKLLDVILIDHLEKPSAN